MSENPSIRAQVVEALDVPFGGRVASDATPPGGLTRPYARVLDGLSEPTVRRGDGRAMATRRTGQVNVVQDWGDESDVVVDEAAAVLDGLDLRDGLHVLVTGRARTVDPDRRLVTHAITWTVARLA